LPDGTTNLIYKSRECYGSTLQLGVARAPRPEGPYERLSEEPIFQFENPDFHVEDPLLWYADVNSICWDAQLAQMALGDVRSKVLHLLVKLGQKFGIPEDAYHKTDVLLPIRRTPI
jgi:hypothetical protein